MNDDTDGHPSGKISLIFFQRIHRHGITHGHFYNGSTIISKNILIRIIEDKGTRREVPCVIKFDKADLAHHCQVVQDVSVRSWGCPTGGIYDPLCEELVQSADVALWITCTFLTFRESGSAVH